MSWLMDFSTILWKFLVCLVLLVGCHLRFAVMFIQPMHEDQHFHGNIIELDLFHQFRRDDLRIFDGHGGLSAGGSSRLLIDYPEPQRSEILDYLFLPNFGASLAVLKLEIGGDTQSTVGTEASHQHSREDVVNCRRGYEGWLAHEAQTRNPNIIIWSLSWGVPGWIDPHRDSNNSSYFTDENIEYQVAWLRCLREEYNVTSNYIGLWNERDQGSVEYVLKLRHQMDRAGFNDVGITVEATWQRLIDNALDHPEFNSSIAAASLHYPCNITCPAALQANKKVWVGEDTPTPFSNWTAASCWGRKLNQHFLKMNATSVVSWALVWSALEGISVPKKINEEKHQFRGNAFLTAEQPWSGHYKVPPALWINAHWGQFVQPGWRYLDNGLGSGFLPKGGSFVTLVPPKHDNVVHGQTVQFSVIVETLQGTCGKHPRDCDVPHFSDWQVLTFNLSSSHFAFSTEQMPIRLDLWCSNSTNAFVKHSDIVVEDSTGSFTVTMPPDTLCTISTVQHAKKGKHQDPPPPAPFPTTYQSDFSAIEGDHLSWLFSDVYGSFAVRDGSLTQVATALPIGWAPVNIDPLTLFGDRHWNRVHLQVVAKVNHTAFHHYIRICGGCGNVSYRRILFECPESLCFKLFGDGKWMFGNISGTLDVFRDTWHEMEVGIEDRVMSVNFDHRLLLSSPAIDTTGMVGIGCGSYHMCAIRSFSVSADSVSSTL